MLTPESVTVSKNSGSVEAVILVVEDAPHLRQLMRRILIREGFGVAEAGDGHEALHQLEAGLDPVAIVCDVDMPILDGRKFYQAVPRRYRERFLFCTSADPATLPGPVLEKPFTANDLVRAVHRAVR